VRGEGLGVGVRDRVRVRARVRLKVSFIMSRFPISCPLLLGHLSLFLSPLSSLAPLSCLSLDFYFLFLCPNHVFCFVSVSLKIKIKNKKSK
jgi:hypothetical protein